VFAVWTVVCVLGCVLVFRLLDARRELQLKSTVKTPVRLALHEIGADMEARRYGVAQSKLALLSRSWDNFSCRNGIDGSEVGNVMPLFRLIDENGGKQRESVTPRLSPKFGVPLMVWGKIRGGDPRRKAYDKEARFIRIRTVNGNNVECERITLPLSAMNPGTLRELSSLPLGTSVIFSGFESVRDYGLPDFPDMESVTHQAYGIANVFVVRNGGETLDIYELDCGKSYRVGDREYTFDELAVLLKASPVKWTVLYMDKRSSAEENEQLRRFRALCERLGKVLEVTCQRSTSYDDPGAERESSAFAATIRVSGGAGFARGREQPPERDRVLRGLQHSPGAGGPLGADICPQMWPIRE